MAHNAHQVQAWLTNVTRAKEESLPREEIKSEFESESGTSSACPVVIPPDTPNHQRPPITPKVEATNADLLGSLPPWPENELEHETLAPQPKLERQDTVSMGTIPLAEQHSLMDSSEETAALSGYTLLQPCVRDSTRGPLGDPDANDR